jgi:phage baseplate assembly protein W
MANEDREKIFGTDLQLAERFGGLDLIPGAGGDIRLANGNDNIVQALTLRLKVRRGELAALGWPNYGSRLHELIGEPNNNRTRTILMAHARNAIMEDPRVVDVLKIEAQVLPGERDTVRTQMQIQLIEEQVPLNFVFDVSLGNS